MPADDGRQRQQEVVAPMSGRGKSRASSGQEMAAQQEAKVAHQEGCSKQLAVQTRGEREEGALAGMMQRRNERASVDIARLAGGG